MIRRSFVMESPLGCLRLSISDEALTRIDWTDEPANEPTPDDESLLANAVDQLTRYFAGDLQHFTLPLAPAGTPFRQKVWAALQDVPYGQTRSYGDIARLVQSAPRAIGGACGANPIPIIIPCHRVLAGTGLGGYSSPGGLETKQFLLRHEARRRS